MNKPASEAGIVCNAGIRTTEKKPKQACSRKRMKILFLSVMLAYPLAHLFVFWFLVNLNSIIMTFQKFSWDTGDYVFNGVNNYIKVFREIASSPVTKRAVINSILYLPVTNFISLPLCILFSYFLFKKVPATGVFRVIFFLPSIMPIAVLTMAFSFTFDATLGPVNTILKMIGIKNIPSWFGFYPNNQIMVFVYCIWAGLGVNIILLSGAMSRISQDVIEYGKIEGVSKSRELFQLIIPLVWPTITTTFILGCTSVYTVMLQPLLLTPGSSDTLTIALMIYNGVLADQNLPYLSTFGLALSLIGVPFIMLIKFLLGKVFADVEY